MTTPHILVIDDDIRLRCLLRKYLSENSFQVVEAPSADEALPLIHLIDFDLLVMDVMMPGTDGQTMLQHLRQAGNQTPILMLTAMGDMASKLKGLEAGADDYLSKPFEPRELILRINNILRRTRLSPKPTEVSFGSCVFHPKTGALTRDGKNIALTGLETELLRTLVARAGQPVSRAELRTLMNTDNDRTVDVQMTRLRKKIEMGNGAPMCIQTVRGLGYQLITTE